MGFFPRKFPDAAAGPIASASLCWDEVNCPLCGNQRWQTLLEAPDRQASGLWFAVVQCLDCGLCFTNPRPVTATLERFYPGDYRPHQVLAERQSGRWRQFLSRLRRARGPLSWRGQGRLLDFGCGNGAFLQRMRLQGWRVTGVDIAAHAVQRIRNQTGLRVLTGTLPHPELRPNSFDVITMWQSLEHVPDPGQVLCEARRLLAVEGQLVVAVPNIDSLAFRVFGQAWVGLDLPRHLTHFSPWTLHLLLERSGFRVRRIRMAGPSAWLRHSARLACQLPQAKLIHHGLRGKLLSRLAAWYANVTGQADSIVVTATPDDGL
jgi:SAM-dependent methyltransferase